MRIENLTPQITDATYSVQIFQLSKAIRVSPGDTLEAIYGGPDAPMELRVTRKDGSTEAVTSHSVVQRDVRWTLNRYPEPP